MPQLINVAEVMSAATRTISSTVEDLSKGLSNLSRVLRNMNITCATEDGEYKTLGEVFEEMYEKVQEEDIEEKSYTLLRPEALEKTEISNEKMVFDFLEQNAYDHIEPIFKEDINQDHILNTLDIN